MTRIETIDWLEYEIILIKEDIEFNDRKAKLYASDSHSAGYYKGKVEAYGKKRWRLEELLDKLKADINE